ncbi:MAG: glycosyltransferase family 2 protein [Desulfovibrio sp.]
MQGAVNVTVVTYNRLECTKLCLESLLRQTRVPYVLNLIDNNSTDGTREYLCKLQNDERFSQVLGHVILLDDNYGISIAHNLGWSLSDTPYYIKIDNDIEFLDHDWLARMVAVADACPDVAMIGYGKNTSGITYPYDGDETLYVHGHVGGCTLIRKDVHEKLGWWCEDYGLYGEEDTDFGLRARLAGYSNVTLYEEGNPFYQFTEMLDENIAEYKEFKDAERYENLQRVYLLNDTLYKCGVRDLYVDRKFTSVFDDGKVRFKVSGPYLKQMAEWESKIGPILPVIRESDDFRYINDKLGFNFFF